MNDRQVMDPVSGQQLAELRESIQKHGVLEPVVVDQNGEMVDGHTRWELAGELGVDCPSTVVQVRDEEHAIELAATLNLARRHLAEPDRRARVRRLLELGMSQRQVAEQVGVSPATVNRDSTVSSDETVEHEPPERVTGKDGKSRPRHRHTWDDDTIDAIEARLADGETQAAIAAEFGVRPNTLSSALSNARHRRRRPVGLHDKTPEGRQLRDAKVAEMAEAGYTTRQIVDTLSLTGKTVRECAKRAGVEITADAAVGRARHHDADRIASEVAIGLDGNASASELLDPDALSPEVAREWATSVKDSLRTLGKFRKHLEEVANAQE